MLPVVAGFTWRLRVRVVADDACLVRDLAELAHGQVIGVLAASRLALPSPLVDVRSRARDWAVGEVLGAGRGRLGDDRIGRPLDGVAPRPASDLRPAPLRLHSPACSARPRRLR